MLAYCAKRIGQALIVLVGVSLITFLLLNVIPGDPVALMLDKNASPQAIANLRHEWGLDRPLGQQYVSFVFNAARGNLGNSYFEKTPVLEMLVNGLSATLKLGGIAFIFSGLIGIVLGTLAAMFRGRGLDHALMVTAMLGISLPVFWIAIVLQIVFGLKLRWLPISGVKTMLGYVLPVIALGSTYAGSMARLVRTSVLEELSQDYVKTAHSKGLHGAAVMIRHVLRNAAIPVVTLSGTQIKSILTGSMIIESIFSIAGIGRIAVSAIMVRDIPVIQGTVLYTAALFILINLAIDLLYGIIDPKISVSKSLSVG
ncbi:glutathione ABC transporter permease [Clostridia bacterium]|nr:glutathione ABC transporter permease [Clostridia bacterium]